MPSPVPALLSALRVLKRGNCHFALITCNTAHAFIPQIKEESRLQILNIIQCTVQEMHRLCGANASVGLLATNGTLKNDVYPTLAMSMDGGAQFLSPLDLERGADRQSTVMQCIYGSVDRGPIAFGGGIKSGVHLREPKELEKIRHELGLIIEQFAETGAKAVVLGCTELPLVLDAETVQHRIRHDDFHVIDPMAVAARIAVRIAAGEEDLPQ